MEIPVSRRRFATLISLPPLARIQVRNPDLKPTGLHRLMVKATRAAASLLHGRLKLPARGVLQLTGTSGGQIVMPVDVSKSVYIDFASREAHGGYEPAETRLIEAALARSAVFYDIGANWGYYSWLAATHPHFRGRVYSFEISPPMVRELEAIRRAAGFDNVTIMPFGLSDRSGRVRISGGRHDHLTRIVEDTVKQATEAEVQRLDDLGLPPPDLVKIDVEDHEPAVIAGAAGLIGAHKPAILFECRDANVPGAAALFEWLSGQGYRFHAIELFDNGIRLIEIDTDAQARGTRSRNVFAATDDRRDTLFR